MEPAQDWPGLERMALIEGRPMGRHTLQHLLSDPLVLWDVSVKRNVAHACF